MLHHDSVICKKCHNTILQESLPTCIICENTVAKKCLVAKHKYSLLKHTMPQIANIPNNRRQFARLVTYNYNKILYVCCSRNVEKSMCQLYRKAMNFKPLFYHNAYHM